MEIITYILSGAAAPRSRSEAVADNYQTARPRWTAGRVTRPRTESWNLSEGRL